VELLNRSNNNQEECPDRNQEHEMEQQHGVTSEPVVVAGDLRLNSNPEARLLP
jgi:hypothetical protein